MVAYVAYLIAVLWQSELIDARKSKKRKAIFVFLCFVELFLLTGLRGYDVGSDTRTYLDRFLEKKGITFFGIFELEPKGFEYGYQIFQNFCAFTGMNETGYLLAVAAVIYIPFFVFVYKYSEHPEISILVYFAFNMFYYSLGIFRQMIALSLCLTTVPLILKRKPVSFVVVTCIAGSFHMTAFVWMVTYFLYAFINRRQIKWAILIAAVALPVGEILMKPIFELIERYHFYFDNIENYRTSPDDSFFMFFVFCSILIATQVFGYFEKKKTPCERLSLMCLCLCVIEVSLARFFALTARAVTYFSVYLTITLPSWLEKCFDDKWRYYFRVALTLALLIITITMSFYGNKHICPFVFFWQ